jgi:hypothetical protein
MVRTLRSVTRFESPSGTNRGKSSSWFVCVLDLSNASLGSQGVAALPLTTSPSDGVWGNRFSQWMNPDPGDGRCTKVWLGECWNRTMVSAMER